MTYPNMGGPGAYPQPGQAPGPPPNPPRPNTWARLGLAAAVLAAGIGGGIIGSLLTNRDDTATTSATTDTAATTDTSATTSEATPEYIHSQDVKLCTEYAFISVSITKPVESSRDLVPAAAALRTSLAAYPDASADIRAALNDVADGYFARMSNLENRGDKGLVESPKYDEAAVQEALNHAWAICGLE